MQVRVLLFSVLKEKCGTDALSLVFDASEISGEALLDAVEAQYPLVSPYRRFVRLAVNQVYRAHETRISDGDEVALITPVSGG